MPIAVASNLNTPSINEIIDNTSPSWGASCDDSVVTSNARSLTWCIDQRVGGVVPQLGDISYSTETGGVQLYQGDPSSGVVDGWVTLAGTSTSGNNLTMHGLGNGDVVHVNYDTSCGNIIATPRVYVETAENKEDRVKRHMRHLIKSNLSIRVAYPRQKTLSNKSTKQEEKARSTLRDLISERNWRRYLTNGFVMVDAPSGNCYQVFNDQSHIKVYRKGKITDEICIHTTRDCPPTDHILNIMSLLSNDEPIIWSKGVGNVYNKNGNPNHVGNLTVATVARVLSDAEAMDGFILGGHDVPNVYVGNHGDVNIANPFMDPMDPLVAEDTLNKKDSLVETYRKLKVA